VGDDEPLKEQPLQRRHWIWSHHIYSQKKRHSMVEWCSELKLRGACLAGKPGLIIVEGDADCVREFIRYNKIAVVMIVSL